MPKKMTPAEIVILRLGVRPLARALGKDPATVIRWRERGGRIPSKHHLKIIELSDGKISAEDLVHGH